MSTVQTANPTSLSSSILQQALASSTVAASGAAGTTSAGAALATNGTDLQDRFLKLLVAQMNNQDPLNPLDNSQVTSQMAQISTVTGIAQLNQTMSGLSAGLQSPLAAVAVIGHSVLLPGDTINRVAATDGPVKAGFELASAADQVSVQVVDATGNAVYSSQLGATAAGVQTFQWDATNAPAGAYRIKVTAQAGGQPVTATALTASPVLGISQASDGVHLELSGRGSVLASDAKAII